jgi:RNA polymerase sigma-70 factor (ECF subfamily)
MTNSEAVETEFMRARVGDADAFAEWMKMVEYPLRRSVARFARHADLEGVVQETLLRMWIVACDPARQLDGESASLKFAIRVARNVALEELRRTLGKPQVPLEDLPEIPVEFDFPDPLLRENIDECFGRLPSKPKSALRARIQAGHQPDRDLAAGLRMTLNTFLQNIVRARKFMAQCLGKRGVRLEGIFP